MVELVDNTSLDEKFLDGSDNQFEDESMLSKETKIVEVVENSDDAADKVATYLKCRMEPINELVISERNYVERLKLVTDKYIPSIDDANVNIPEDLSNKWRIIWGNWLQLDMWHSSFLEKLDKLVVEDPDGIPKLFLDSRAKLRTIYSKYCENHRKASVIAEQYRDFFEERRIIVGDKQDVVSHLMQPVQRIMRYQLPMSLIVKLTKRANLPSLHQWERALEVMKEIPKDTQLILEAARIDGFPQSITALGNIRMRGELNVAVSSKSELERDSCSITDLKFLERRVFLFDQMLLITEEVKTKRKDPFAQCTYMFKNAINVNKMKFHPRWTFGGNENEQIEHETIFMISDESPDRDKIYIIDPLTDETREQWVIQLRDIQRMQQDFLLALQDPKRFASKVDSSNSKDHSGGLLKPVSESDASSKDGGRNRGSSKKKQKGFTFNATKSGSAFIKHLRPRSEKSATATPSPATPQTQPPLSPAEISRVSTNVESANSSPKFSAANSYNRNNSSSSFNRKLSSSSNNNKDCDKIIINNISNDTSARVSCANSNTNSESDDADNRSLDSVSVANSNNSFTASNNKRPATAGNNNNNKTKFKTNVGPCDILNDEDDSATMKQRAWSAFSFRLRRSKRDPKITSHCYSKSDELGNIGNQTSRPLSPGKTSATPNLQQQQSKSQHPHKKRSGNIFHMFTSNRNKHKASSPSCNTTTSPALNDSKTNTISSPLNNTNEENS